MITVQAWVLWVVGTGSAVLGSAITLVGTYFTRKGSKEARLSAVELGRRAEHEEAMRTFRWALELAMSKDTRTANTAVDVLRSLATSDLLSLEDRKLIFVVTRGILARGVAQYSETGEEVIVDISETEEGS